MSDIKQEVVFPNSGMDTDSDERFIAPGDSTWRLHVMVAGNQAMGVLTNMLGNELTIDISDHKLILSQTYNTVASYYNKLTRKVYYWVFGGTYDSGGGVFLYDNRLLCYNEDIGTLDLIFIDTKNWFGLSLTSLFKDSAMIADWLYFNPKISEPKMIDVVRAYNYTNYVTYSTTSTFVYGDKMTFYGGLFVALSTVSTGESPITHPEKWNRIGDSYRDETDLTAFSSEFEYAFNVIKMPPIERPVVTYQSDTQINVNNIRGKLFRFSYRYKYFDNSYSKYSSYSDITLPEDDEVYNGEILNKTTTNNYIKIAINPHSPALVKEIEIVVLESSSATATVPANWKRVKVINRQEQAELTTFDMSFNFYNNESYIEVTDIEVATIEDYVPQRANSMEIINKNILGYGGCLEGHNNIPKDEIRVSLTPVLQSINLPANVPGTTIRDNVYHSPSDVSVDTNFLPSKMVMKISMSWALGGVTNGDQYYITIDGVTNVMDITTPQAASQSALINAVTAFIRYWYPHYIVDNRSGALYVSIVSPDTHFADITQSLFCTVGTTTSTLTKKRGFKTGANQPFCLYYYDGNMRRWDAQVSKDNVRIFGLQTRGTTVYVPQFNEVSPIPTDTAHKWTIDWEVYHLPPEGAKYWRWGYAGNSLETTFVQYIISDIVASDPTTDGANMCKIDITPLQTLKTTTTDTPGQWNQYPNSVIDAYTWAAGDRVRFITVKSVPSSGTTLGNLIDGVYEYEILKQDNTANTIFTQAFDFASLNIGENSLIEIYSPKKSISDVSTIYYEFGDIMPISPDTAGIMTHQGQAGLHNQDTALSHAAMGTFDGGDIYHIMRTPSKPIDTITPSKGFFHESMFYSDFYNSDDWNKGKIGIETTFGQRFLNIVRYSRPYFQDTEINGLPTFEEDDANGWAGYKEYNDIFGDIIAICEFGDTLKVYQERKPSSTLVGRTEYMDSQGEVNVAISTVVLGAIRYDKSNYSTVLSESISRNNDFIYGFDIYNGVAWRDGNNGIFPISGRYATEENNNDYKMQTYFKLKAKALMESGIDHVSVLTVWDEEYKLVYFVFKDSVVQANNETIVFHQPSNRWVTFAEFNQSGTQGFDTPLEPSPYIIVQGFENGIGYSFNEVTRFAHFNIGGGLGTTAQTPVPGAILKTTVSIATPTITITTGPTPLSDNILISVATPTVHVSGIASNVDSMEWTALQNGSAVGLDTIITLIGGGSAWLQACPAWVTVVDGHILSLDEPIHTGDTLSIYPNSTNGSVLKTGQVVLQDSFGNTKTIYVRQDAPITDPVVIISINPLDITGLTKITGSGSCSALTTRVNLDFTIHKPGRATGQPYTVYYAITRNGVADVSGSLDIRDGIEDITYVLLNSNSIVGETIIVYLSGTNISAPTGTLNASVSEDNLAVTMTNPKPTIRVTSIWGDVSSMDWLASDSGQLKEKTITFVLEGAGGLLISKPDWIIVEDSITQIYTDTFNDGDSLWVYPSGVNTGALRTGYVRFGNIYGDSFILTVTQEETLVNASVTVEKNPTDISSFALTNTSGVATNGNTGISITFTPNNPLMGYYASIALDYQIWNGVIMVGNGTLTGMYNRASNTISLTMSNVAHGGDSIIVYLSIAV